MSDKKFEINYQLGGAADGCAVRVEVFYTSLLFETKLAENTKSIMFERF